jgi:PleD family two-component response regulator
VANLTDQEKSLAELLGRADAALYQAKAAGRDRVVQAEAGPSSPTRNFSP